MTAPARPTDTAELREALDELRALDAKATPGEWLHYDEVFRPQFSARRITEIQRAKDGRAIISWSGFDGLPPATERKRNHNARFIVTLVRLFRLHARSLASLIAERDAALAERDEADRRAGSAERALEHERDASRKRSMWLSEAKKARGYSDSTSFDRVWAETCAKADAGTTTDADLAKARAENERLRADKALLLKVIDAGKCEAAFAYADESDGSADAATRRIRLENIRNVLNGVGDIEARKALGLLVETIDGEPTQDALSQGASHDAEA